MSLAVISGSGDLPVRLVKETGAIWVKLNNVHTDIGSEPNITAQFERLGDLFSDLAEAGVQEICFAGAMGRPKLDPSLFDATTLELMPRLVPLLQSGDDALLRGIIEVFEEKGFSVCAPHEFLAGLLVEPGVMTRAHPEPRDEQDAQKGKEILQTLSVHDIGQGCVVSSGQVLGIEALYGTDAMLDGIAQLRQSRQPNMNGVFVKRAKDGQDLRVDLPTIGPETIDKVISADLSAICLQAAYVQVLDRKEVLERANAAGLVIWATD